MSTIDIPPSHVTAAHIVAFAEAVKGAKSSKWSFRAVELGAGVSPGLIALMKAGKGFNYETAYKLLSFMKGRFPELEPVASEAA